MKRLWLILAFVVCLFSAPRAHAVACNLTSGASVSTINAALVSARAAGCTGTANSTTVSMGAGTYSDTTGITVPCGANAITWTGPAYVYSPTNLPTATLSGPVSGGFMVSISTCSVATTIAYLGCNGNRPGTGSGGGGGGCFDYSQGVSNVAFIYNYVYGQQANICGCEINDAGVYMEGIDSSNSNPLTDSNDTFLWNRFGNVNGVNGNTDCSNLMGTFSDNGGSYDSSGGNCVGIGTHSYENGLLIQNNVFNSIEQGIKFFEAGQCCNPTIYYHFYFTNVQVLQNEFNGIHRIGFEAQITPQGTTGLTVNQNSYHTGYYIGYGSWAFSLPSCCQSPLPNNVNCYDNTMIADTIPVNYSSGGYDPGAFEWWSQGTCNRNLIQGYFANGIDYGYTSGTTWLADYNVCQLQTSGVCVVDEGYGSKPVPTGAHNTLVKTVGAQISAIPVITPTPSGSYSGTVNLTITDNGLTSGLGPQGNTNVYYTTDGSTPTVTNGTYCVSPCSVSIAAGTTIKAIGMWGSLNQPRTYATNYGWVPSAVASQNYPSSGTATPTVTGVTLSLVGGGSALQVGKSVQACANMTYSNGATTQVCGSGADSQGTTPNTWTSSATGVATITTSGSVAGVAAGSTNLTVKAGSFTSPNFALTVSAPAPTLQSVAITGCSTLTVGQTATCVAQCTYTGPTVSPCTSSTWTSDATGVATVNSTSGVVTGVAAGTVHITAVSGGITSTPATLTVTSNTPPAATLSSVAISCSPGSVIVGNSLQCQAFCTYSDATQTNCTTADAHSITAGTWASSSTGIATINSASGIATGVAAGSTTITAHAGAFTSAAVNLQTVAVPTSNIFGQNATNTVATTTANYINAGYAKTPAGVTSTVGACVFYLPSGTYTAGSLWDCGAVLAPTSTTQASSWLCYATYTAAGTSADVGWHYLPIAGCGGLPGATGYWVDLNTNSPGHPNEGFYNCGGTCAGSAPTSGIGTYPCAYISAPYGIYTGMGTAMNVGACGPGQVQTSQYLVLTSPTPTLVGGYMVPQGVLSFISQGAVTQLTAYCSYSDGTSLACYPTADQYGNTITAWSSSAAGIASVGSAGGAHPGLVMGNSAGVANINATATGGIALTPLPITVLPNTISIAFPGTPGRLRQ